VEQFKVTTVFETPTLLQDLGTYAEEGQGLRVVEDLEGLGEPSASKQSALFLRIQSAASFYTNNKDLMQHPPPVDVDISMLQLLRQDSTMHSIDLFVL
jgi:hypothetical protein